MCGVSPGRRWKSPIGDAAGGLVGAEQLDLGVERGQRDGHVRRMGGDAGVARAEDRVDPVEPAERRAAGAGLALVAGRGRVVEVGAAGALQQVAADGRLVAQLARGAGEQRLREHRVAGAHPGVGGERRCCAAWAPIRRPPSGSSSMSVERQAADVDQVGRLLDLELHQVEQVGAAADELRAGLWTPRPTAAGGVRRPLVGEGPHRRPPSATSRIAATMFG